VPYKWQIAAKAADDLKKLPVWLQETVYDELEDLAAGALSDNATEWVIQLISERRGGIRYNAAIRVHMDHASSSISLYQIKHWQEMDPPSNADS
jgi:hypothetical protein